jgi:prepilin-type processing-associated H-X9-DG protein
MTTNAERHLHSAELSDRVLIESILCDMRTQCRECGDTDALRLLAAPTLTLSDMQELVAFRALIAHVCMDVRVLLESKATTHVYVDFLLGETLCEVAWNVRQSYTWETGTDVCYWDGHVAIRKKVWDMWFAAWSCAMGESK